MFDPYHKWLGIPTSEQPPHHYRLLGVQLFEKDLDVIEGAADKQMAFVRQYQSGEHAAEAARLLSELALARLCLLKPPKKSEYDAKLRKKIAISAKPDPEEAFADMALPEVASTSILELPKRKKKSRKTKWPKVPPGLVKLGVIAVIAIVLIPFIPALLKAIPRTDFVTNVEQPPAQTVAPQQTEEIRASNTVASPPPQLMTQSDPTPQKQEISTADPFNTDGPAQTMESKPANRPAVSRAKSSTSTIDPDEPVSLANEMVGGNGGMAKTLDLKGKTMIGVDWAPGEWFGTPALSKVFPVSTGSPQNMGCNRTVAPKGYAVGAINVVAPKYVSSLQLVFMKINEDGSLDPSDKKLSKWLGAKPKGEVTTLSGEGKRLIGLQLRQAVVVDAIGILVEP